MSLSRYRNLNTIDDKKGYETSTFPSKEELDAIAYFQLRVGRGDRLDNLASKHLGSGEYWWVIAVVNDLEWAFGFEDGQIIKIPLDVQDVLKLF